jgi:phosphate transport system substrate-binding protein
MTRLPFLCALACAALFCTPAEVCGAAPDELSAADRAYASAVAASFPVYRAAEPVSGLIRLWGHGNVKLPWMMNLVHRWESGFQRFQPGIKIRYEMHGTSSAVPSLYTGVGDIAILGEEILPEAVGAFERAKHYPPTVIPLLTGSLSVRNFDYAQMFFVHRDNPLTHVSLQQLDGVFGAEHRRGDRVLRHWGDLGLTDDWAGRTITPYGWRIDDSFGIFLEGALLEGSHRWNNGLHEYAHIPRPDGSIYDHGQQILDALAKDRSGIAVSNIRYAGPAVKALAVGATAAGPFVAASVSSLIDQTYPLTRLIPAVVDCAPGVPLDPKVREFLSYILSRQGQESIVSDGRYLPLAKRTALIELGRLERLGTPSAAETPAALSAEPVYRAAQPVQGTVRVWGTVQMQGVVRAWTDGLRRVQPGLQVDIHLMGTATGMPGIYLGTADVALLGREPNTTDRDGFLHVTQYRPLQLQLMSGSYDRFEESPALAVLVHRDNPLAAISMDQLAAIFGADSDRTKLLRDWGQLGLGGAWSRRGIRLYAPETNSGTGLFFAHAVLADGRKWNWDALEEFHDTELADGTIQEADRQIVAALERDPAGLALANPRFATAGTRVLAVKAQATNAAVRPSRETTMDRTYPLARSCYAFANRPPGTALDPKVREFFRYALSRDGQRDVARVGGYLPLSPAERDRQSAELEK